VVVVVVALSQSQPVTSAVQALALAPLVQALPVQVSLMAQASAALPPVPQAHSAV